MINRILIRIKVIQILYSYLLSRNDFQIDTTPRGTARDRDFAYAVYLDMLMLIQELSGIRITNGERRPIAIDVNKYLRTNRIGRALADNDTMRGLQSKNLAHLNTLAPLMQGLSDRITSSAAFTDYSRKRSRSLEDDVRLWSVILETVILKDKELTQALRTDPDFSLSGFHHGVQAAVETLRSYGDSRAAYLKARTDLRTSLDKAAELYYALFALIVDLTQEQADRLEAAKNKYLASAEDRNPDTRLVNNALAAKLAACPAIEEYRKNTSFNWIEVTGLLPRLLDLIHGSEAYARYMSAPATSWADDCEFWREIMRSVILPSDDLAEALEGASVYWNDDPAIIGTFVLKTLRRFAGADPEAEPEFLPRFNDEEDEKFGEDIFIKAVENRETYRGYIDRFINPDWDPDRLAFMDIVIMTTAIAEIVGYPNIPIPVSLNEYIQIANDYSTHRSGPFINGILFSVISMLVDEGKVLKEFNRAPINDQQNNPQ